MPEHQQTQKFTEPKPTSQKRATHARPSPISSPMAIIQRAKINPRSLTPADVMQLQRTIGNRAVGRLLSEIGLIPSKAKQAPPVQRQELVQRQEIPEEEEPLQGKMAETVQRQEIPEEEEPLQGMFEGKPKEETCPSCMQRQEIPEEEEPLQGKFETIQRLEPEDEEKLQMKSVVQRQEIPEEEEPLQGKMVEPVQRQEIPEEEEPLQGKMIGTIQRQETPEEEEFLQTKRENNTGMPDNLKAGVESLSGIDMSDVRVHYNSSKPAEVGALAYTQGTNIHVASGQERHLPHEAWHVVQQAQGRVKPTMQVKDVAISDDKGLEKEAELMGAKTSKIYFSEKDAFESSIYLLDFNNLAPVTSVESSNNSSVIQRAPTLDSMKEALKGVPGFVALVTRVINSSSGVPYGKNDSFTVDDLVKVLDSVEGYKYFQEKLWRDTSGEKWGQDQTRQGQHEWIPTNNVPKTLVKLLKDGKKDEALKFLAAADSLRTPTTEVFLGIEPNPRMVEAVNALDPSKPEKKLASQIGEFSHHTGGMHTETKDIVGSKAPKLHSKLDEIAVKYAEGKASFTEMLLDVHGHVVTELSDAQIPGLDPKKAALVISDFMAGARPKGGAGKKSKGGAGKRKKIERYGKLALTSSMQEQKEGGVTYQVPTVSYQPAVTLAEFQQAASEARERNVAISANRVNTLMTMLPQTTLTYGTSQWSQIERQEAYVSDVKGFSVDDYDIMYEEAKTSGNTALVKQLEEEMSDAVAPDMMDTPTFGVQGPELPIGPTTAPLMDEFDLRVNNFITQAREHYESWNKQRQEEIFLEVLELVLELKLPNQQAPYEFTKRKEAFLKEVNKVNQFAEESIQIFQQDREQILKWLYENQTKCHSTLEFEQLGKMFSDFMNKLIEQFMERGLYKF